MGSVCENHTHVKPMTSEGAIVMSQNAYLGLKPDSEIVMVDLAIVDDLFEQGRPFDDFGTTISGNLGTQQNSFGSKMSLSLMVPRVDSKLVSCS